MAFFYEPGFRPIRSFAQARERLALNNGFTQRHTRELRGPDADPHDSRALDGKRKHVTIRLMSPEEVSELYSAPWPCAEADLAHIACRLHRTDVVIYREDDAVRFERYPSVSTNKFVDYLVPNHVNVHFALTTSNSRTSPFYHNLIQCDNLTLGEGSMDNARWWTSTDKRVYRMKGGTIWLKPDATGQYVPLDPDRDIEPWVVPVIDTKLARAALKATNYREFMDYARAVIQMERLRYTSAGRSFPGSDATLLRDLADQSHWMELVRDPAYWSVEPERWGSGWKHARYKQYHEGLRTLGQGMLTRGHASRLEKALRRAVYRTTPGVLTTQPAASLANVGVVAATLRRLDYYGLDA